MSQEKQKKEALRWLRQAKEDLISAEILNREKRFSLSCFLSHQAAEKALKAVWILKDKDPWGHSLKKLVEDLGEKFLEGAEKDLIYLDKFYIPTRYPNGVPYPLIPEEVYKEEDSRKALKVAEKIIKKVEKGFF